MLFYSEALRQQRKQHFSNYEKMRDASGLSNDAIKNVEKGYSGTTVETLKRYCEAIGVDHSKYLLNISNNSEVGPFRLRNPRAIDFRPFSVPNLENDQWKSSRTMISMMPFDIRSPINNNISFKIEEVSISFTNFFLGDEEKSISILFKWIYWVSIEHGVNNETKTDLGYQDIWLGVVGRNNGQSTVLPYNLNPGENDVRELMFMCDEAPSWRNLTKRFRTLGKDDLKFEVMINYSSAYEERGSQKFHFFVENEHVSKIIKEIDSLEKSRYTYGSVSRIQLCTKQ